MRYLILILCLGFCLSSFAKATEDKLDPGFITCPKASELHKDPKTQFWGANGGWKSFEISFTSHIGKFLGAQWQGMNVGNVTCVYRGNESMSFPITLRFNHLAYAPKPTKGKWGENRGGYVNCKATEQKECSFKPQPKKKTANS